MISKRKKTERDDQIVRLILSGIDAAIIARQMDVHVSTVYDALKTRSILRVYCTAEERRQIALNRAAA